MFRRPASHGPAPWSSDGPATIKRHTKPMKSLGMHSLRRVRRSSGLWAILTALSLVPLLAHAAQPQSVEGTGVYLWLDPGQGQPNPGGRIRTHVQAIAMIDCGTPLLQGLLQWEGDFNVDQDWNGTGSGSGTIQLGTWSGTTFTPTDGVWITRFEAHGNFNIADLNTGYVGICVAHGISGRVKGMIAVLPFTGAPGTGPFAGTLVDVYEDGQIIIPHAAK